MHTLYVVCQVLFTHSLWTLGPPSRMLTIGPPTPPRGVPGLLTITIKQTPRHPFFAGVANYLLYTVGFRQRHAIKWK